MPRRILVLAATHVALLFPVRASAEERFFVEPTTDTQPPSQPGFTALDSVGSPEGYLVEGIIGLGRRVELGLDYVNTPNHQLLAVGRVRLLDEKRFTPAFAVGVDNSTVSTFGTASAPSPDEVYANATKTLGLVRVMAGAYRVAPGYAHAGVTRDIVGALAAAELDLGRAQHSPADAPAGPPAFDLIADYAGGNTALGQIGLGLGFHPNDHLNVQPGFALPTNRRWGPPRFQLQLHVN